MAIADDDLGWNRIKKELRSLNKVEITVGIHSDYVAQPMSNKKSSAMSVAEYAYANEFGTDKIPARPFIATAFDENVDRWKDKIQSNISAVYEDQKTLKNAIGEIAYMVSGDTVKKVDSIYSPPNAPATIKQKGSSKPLVDTGRMRASILPLIKWA